MCLISASLFIRCGMSVIRWIFIWLDATSSTVSHQTSTSASVGGSINFMDIDESPVGSDSSGSGRSIGDGSSGSKGLLEIPRDYQLFQISDATSSVGCCCFSHARNCSLWCIAVRSRYSRGYLTCIQTFSQLGMIDFYRTRVAYIFSPPFDSETMITIFRTAAEPL